LQQYQIDIIRGVHLLALALGLGTSAYLDLRNLTRFHRPVSGEMVAEFHRIHRLVFVALGLLWLSGLALGSSKLLKVFNWDMLIHLFLPAFAAILLITELVALLAPAASRIRHGRH